MNKGFTMVELIATIVILSMIVIIAVPSYINVSTSIKKKNLESKEKAISSAMLKFANKYLIDDIKPANEKCTDTKKCCQKYDLYNYIVENGIYVTDENDETDYFIADPVNNKRLEGCVKIVYNKSKFQLEASFEDSCNMLLPVESCV